MKHLLQQFTSSMHCYFILTGICAAGKTPIWLAPVLKLRARRLLPSKLPNDSGNPNSSPTLKPFYLKRKQSEKKVKPESELHILQFYGNRMRLVSVSGCFYQKIKTKITVFTIATKSLKAFATSSSLTLRWVNLCLILTASAGGIR